MDGLSGSSRSTVVVVSRAVRPYLFLVDHQNFRGGQRRGCGPDEQCQTKAESEVLHLPEEVGVGVGMTTTTCHG